MIVVIILVMIIIGLLYVLSQNKEFFDTLKTNQVVAVNDERILNNAEVPNENNGSIPNPHIVSEDERIENYRNKFFSFGNRVNHCTHLSDPVDKMHLMGDNVGKNIADIYDEILNVDDYKTHEDELCPIITPDR